MFRIFKNKIFLLVLTTLVLFVLIGVSAKGGSGVGWSANLLNTIVSPFQNFFSTIGDTVEGGLGFFEDKEALQKENDDLKAKVEALEKERDQLLEYRNKNKDLREALNIKEQFSDYDSIGANIIAKDMGNWFNVFTIDVGSHEGIRHNDPVITGKGLVGRVQSTGPISSKVVSVIDQDSTVSARISKTKDLVVVRGDLTLKNEGLCRLDYIPPDADIGVGDKIETSGIGGIYPKGIEIGRVKEVRRTNNQLNRYAIISPSVDFKRIEEVLVLKNKSHYNETGRVEE